METTVQNTTTRPTLTLGSTGEDVKYLQKVLNATVADNSLVVDGVFGQKTKEAVMAFQKEKGLAIDGIVGAISWAIVDTTYISLSPTLRRGSTDESVKHLQRRLNILSYGSLEIDGIFGARTEEAVKKFQQSHNLVVDGIVGKSTWDILESLG